MVQTRPIPSHAILRRASLCVYMLQQHMAVTCCQGSLSPGLASPALGQMAAHWAPKTNCAARDTPGPAPSLYLGSSCLPGGLFSCGVLLTCQTPLCTPVDSDLIGFPSKLNGKRQILRELPQNHNIYTLSQFNHSPEAAQSLLIIKPSSI